MKNTQIGRSKKSCLIFLVKFFSFPAKFNMITVAKQYNGFFKGLLSEGVSAKTTERYFHKWAWHKLG